jgi:hypothetical protein
MSVTYPACCLERWADDDGKKILVISRKKGATSMEPKPSGGALYIYLGLQKTARLYLGLPKSRSRCF